MTQIRQIIQGRETNTKIPVSKPPSGHHLVGQDPFRGFKSSVVNRMNSKKN